MPGDAVFSMDFATEGGNGAIPLVNAGDGALHFGIRDSGSTGIGDFSITEAWGWTPTWTVLLPGAVIYDDDVAVAPLVHNLRMVTHNFGGLNPSYDITITDSNGTVHSATGLANWGHVATAPTSGISAIDFQMAVFDQRSDFVVDNVSVVPEPATLSLLALGGLALIRRRRR